MGTESGRSLRCRVAAFQKFKIDSCPVRVDVDDAIPMRLRYLFSNGDFLIGYYCTFPCLRDTYLSTHIGTTLCRKEPVQKPSRFSRTLLPSLPPPPPYRPGAAHARLLVPTGS